jgi:hypothetical protein
MRLLSSLFFVVLCLSVPAWAAPPQAAPNANGSAPKQVFSAGTNAYTLSITSQMDGQARVGVGRSASLLVTVTPIDGYNQPVKLACDKLPPETSCTFDVETMPAGGGTTTMLFNTAAPHNCGATTPYYYGSSASLRYLGPVLAGLLMLWMPRRRLRMGMRALFGLVVLCGMLGLEGCGNCTDFGTKPGTYTFVLNGTGKDTVALALGDLITVPITIQVNE